MKGTRWASVTYNYRVEQARECGGSSENKDIIPLVSYTYICIYNLYRRSIFFVFSFFFPLLFYSLSCLYSYTHRRYYILTLYITNINVYCTLPGSLLRHRFISFFISLFIYLNIFFSFPQLDTHYDLELQSKCLCELTHYSTKVSAF